MGGFLGGADGQPFVLPLQLGINVLIGDRGSGKSTVLSLASLLSASTTERTNVLVTAVLNLLHEGEEEENSRMRRIWNVLNQYGVEKYVCFFHNNRDIYSFYIELEENGYDILCRINGNWISTPNQIMPPPMQVFRQGEIFRITEDKEYLALNNIIDGLYPELHNQRKNLAAQLNSLRSQFINLNIEEIKIEWLEFSYVINNMFNDLDEMQKKDTHEVLDIIESYLYDYDTIELSKQDSEQENSMINLLQNGRTCVLSLYIGKIYRFLRHKVKILQELNAQLKGKKYKVNELLEIEKYDNLLSSIEKEDNVNDWPMEPLEHADVSVDLDNDKEIIVSSTLDFDNQVQMDIKKNLAEVFTYLKTRLVSIARMLKRIKGRPIFLLNDALESMFKNYIQALKKQNNLLKEQNNICKNISNILSQKNLFIRLFTANADAIQHQYESQISQLKSIKKYFNTLNHSNIFNVSLRDVSECYLNYISSVETLRFELNKLGNIESPIDKEIIFHPVNVELRQGRLYRSFEQLSFGQKSGIILMMVLTITQDKIVIIDQPEDNLDVASIVNMLAPALVKLSQNRLIIIATHNAHLVMGIAQCHLVVLESLGECGRVRISGSLLHHDVVGEMLEVLEGGLPSFEQKMKLYDEFTSRLRGTIGDMDIHLIESSFRRRTIDNLRNFLQPIITDRSIMDFLRHELKQKDPSRLHKDIATVSDDIKKFITQPANSYISILESIDRLLGKFDNHIHRMMDAVEHIRLMDTQPRPTYFDVYSFLEEEINMYKNRLGNRRKINFNLDDSLKNKIIYFDREHLRLILHNIFNNSFRATEKKAASLLDHPNNNFSETMNINLLADDVTSITIQFEDNGIGISPHIKDKLYKERCSDRQGADHGLGGVIIRKLLDLNNGTIRITNTRHGTQDSSTTQSMSLSKGDIV